MEIAINGESGLQNHFYRIQGDTTGKDNNFLEYFGKELKSSQAGLEAMELSVRLYRKMFDQYPYNPPSLLEAPDLKKNFLVIVKKYACG